MLTSFENIKMAKTFKGALKSCAMMLALVSMSACSGGSGTSAPATTPNTEVANSTALEAVNASTAHDQGITGDGVTVAVIDTGLNSDLSEFADVVSVESKSVVTNLSDTTDVTGHGTAVTSVIAAARDNAGMMGIAYDATILAIKADDPVGSFTANRLRMAIDYAIQQNADIVNMSIAGPSAPTFGFINSLSNGVDAGMLFVMASGNRGVDNPDYPARYAGSFTGPGQVISVGSVDSNNVISSFSNRAGDSKNFFLVAPGEGVASLNTSGGVVNQSGTSFAAPLVAGAAALLKQNAPHLTGRQIADILLQTARDLGAVGVDDIYGHGLLDVEQALQPFGSAYIPAGVLVGAGGFGTAVATSVVFDPAFSNALLNSDALKATMALDEFDRAYEVDLASSVNKQETNVDMINWMHLNPVDSIETVALGTSNSLAYGTAPTKWVDAGQVNTNGGFFSLTSVVSEKTEVEASVGLPLSAHLGLSAMDKTADKAIAQISSRHALENPFLSFAGGDLGISTNRKINDKLSIRAGYGLTAGKALTTSATSLRTGTTQMVASVEADYRFSPKLRLAFNAGQMIENGSLLNSYSSGAFSFEGSNTTNFAGVSAHFKVSKNVDLFASYSRGRTMGKTQSAGLINSVSDLKSEAFSIAVASSQTKLLGLISKNRAGLKDSLTLSVSQPLRIVSGIATLDVPSLRDEEGNITRVNEVVSLAPNGRQIDAELNYNVSFGGKNGATNNLAFMAGITRHANHDASAKLVANVGVKLHRTF